MAAIAPHLHDVLANVCRGRVAYICLTGEQKRALRDPDGRIALEVLRHLLGARPMTPERFPLTEQAIQAVRSGFHVSLYRLGRQLRAPRFAKRKRPVGKHAHVKSDLRPRWWQHPLFGDILGLSPPENPLPRARRMKSLDEAFQSPR